MVAEPQLIDYIKKAKDMGQADDQTKSLLAQNGWTEAEINEAFSAMVVQPVIQPQVQPQPQPVAQPIVTQQPQIQPVIQPQVQPQQPQIQYKPQPQYQPAGQNMLPIEGRSNHTAFKLTIVLIILIIIAVGGYFALGQPNLFNVSFSFLNGNTTKTQTKTTVATATPTASQTPTPAAFVKPAFAQYNLSATSFTPALPTYQITLSELANLNNFQKAQGSFSTTQQSALTTDNFFVTKNNDKNFKGDDWTYLYGQIGGNSDATKRQPENSIFITTDFLAHIYSKLINNEFSNIEINNLYPSLDSLSKSLLNSSAAAYGTAADQNQKDSYDRLSAYFLVTSAILDNAKSNTDTKSAVVTLADSLAASNSVSDSAKGIAEQEIGLIFDANTTTSSPLFGNLQNGLQTDYTKFNPTGHYGQSIISRDYFRAMNFYGSMNFLLSSQKLTRDATNIAQLLTSDELKQWESIYQSEAFFAGQGNDLSVYEYNDAANNVGFGASATDDATLAKLQLQLANYQNPQLASYSSNQSPAGFKFMGQMLSPDGFIFSNLTQTDSQPDTTTGQALPKMPTGLMVSTLMGSKVSGNLLNTWTTNNNPNSDKVLANNISTIQSYLNNESKQAWTQNAFWASLDAAQSLFTDSIDKTGYPMFVRSANWDTKNLESFLGLWTEEKHSNSSSQGQSSVASATTNTASTNPVPKGYVEPNVNFLDKLTALVNLTNDGLTQYGLESPDFQSKIATLQSALKFYKTLAVAELQNKNITDIDFEKLRLSAGQLDSILQPPAKSALIANVFTDTTDNKNLYEADGIPNYIFVAVKDANGTRLTKGLVYSYYEFTSSSSKNYTDSTWQGWEYSTIPQKLQMPWWTKSLIP